MQTVYLIKRIENGFYKGGIFYKKTNKFEYGTTFDDAIKFYCMTKDNAEIEYKYLTNKGYTCFIDAIVVSDNKGDCAFSLKEIREGILGYMSSDACTVRPVEAISDYLWSAFLIDIEDEDCKALLDDMVTDETYNVEYHIPGGGYIYVNQ